MRDIIVTTPQKAFDAVAREVEDVKRWYAEDGTIGIYNRLLGRNKPKEAGSDSKVFYVQNGYIRGFAVAQDIVYLDGFTCESTGRTWGGAWYVRMPANTWSWIRPIPMTGFQGWRYFTTPVKIEIMGNWLDTMPLVETDQDNESKTKKR